MFSRQQAKPDPRLAGGRVQRPTCRVGKRLGKVRGDRIIGSDNDFHVYYGHAIQPLRESALVVRPVRIGGRTKGPSPRERYRARICEYAHRMPATGLLCVLSRFDPALVFIVRHARARHAAAMFLCVDDPVALVALPRLANAVQLLRGAA
jgi:hypothetical protein